MFFRTMQPPGFQQLRARREVDEVARIRQADRVKDEQTVNAYLSAAKTIASSGDREMALSALRGMRD